MAGRNTTAFGYGSSHQKLRAKLGPAVASGMVRCARCGKRIKPGERCVLDHADIKGAHKAGLYLGPSHWSCNQAARNRNRAARNRQPPPPPAALGFFNP
jgi:hypothetical protein